MPTPRLTHLGALHLHDLTAMCSQQGREGLPFPLFAPPDTADAIAPTCDTTEMHHSRFWSWSLAWTHADIWVTCRVGHSDRRMPPTRIVACRTGDNGYLGIQHPDEPVVYTYTLGAYDLAPAIADRVGFTTPGTQPRIVVPGYRGHIPGSSRPLPRTTIPDNDAETYYYEPVPRAGVEITRPPASVADTDVTATGVIQSRHQPSDDWGIDWTAPLVTWVQIADDGDYLYDTEHREAKPASTKDLTTRINQLIANDVTALRNSPEYQLRQQY